MKSRRSIAAALAAASLLLVAACSGSSGGGESSGDDFQVAEHDTTAEVEFATWKSDFDWNKVIKGFNQEYPNIKVKVTTSAFKDYFTRLQTQATSDNLPDVFMMNSPNLQLYAKNDQLASLKTLVDKGSVDPKAYPEAVSQPYTYEEQPYAFPFTYDSTAMWYNKSLFKQAGVELPTEEWTWEDMHAAAKKISTKLESKGVYGFAGGAYNQELFYNLIYQAGGRILNEDATKSEYASAPDRAAFQFLRDMVADGSSPSIQTTSDTTPPELFMNGKAAMIDAGSFRVTSFSESPVADDIDLVGMPKGERKAMALIGTGLSMSAGSDAKSAAAAFLSYVQSDRAQKEIAQSGTKIPIEPGLEQTYLASHKEYNLQAYLDAAKNYSYPYPVSVNTQAWVNEESESVPKILSGQVSVEEGTEQLAAAVDKILAEEK